MLVPVLLTVALVGIVLALDDRKRARRMALFAAVLMALSLTACDQEPVAPTVALPSPSPTPVPESDPASCVQRNLVLTVLNGAGNPDALFDYREFLDARATPTNRAGSALAAACDFVRVVGWQAHGPVCSQFGDLTGFATLFRCADVGEVTIIATHGAWKAIWNGLLIRSAGGDLVIAGSTTHSYRQVAGRWEVIQ